MTLTIVSFRLKRLTLLCENKFSSRLSKSQLAIQTHLWGWFLKIVWVGVPTYAGTKTGFHAATPTLAPRNQFSCRPGSDCRLKQSLKPHLWSFQSWALSVFFNFFNNKKWLFCIFYQVDNLFTAPALFKKPTPSQINLIKNVNNHFLVLKKFKTTESFHANLPGDAAAGVGGKVAVVVEHEDVLRVGQDVVGAPVQVVLEGRQVQCLKFWTIEVLKNLLNFEILKELFKSWKFENLTFLSI